VLCPSAWNSGIPAASAAPPRRHCAPARVYLVIETGAPQGEAAAVGVSRQVVKRWMQRYAADGDAGLLDGRRLSARKGKGALTAAEARRVQGWIRDKCPEQLKLSYVLWTAGVVRELIWRRLHKRLGLSTVHLYLRRWEFTSQQPLTPGSRHRPRAGTGAVSDGRGSAPALRGRGGAGGMAWQAWPGESGLGAAGWPVGFLRCRDRDGAKRGSVDALVKLAAALRRWRGGEAVAEGSAGGPQTLALFRKPNRSPSNPLILWWAQ